VLCWYIIATYAAKQAKSTKAMGWTPPHSIGINVPN
jgi:hypothetical protein